MAKVVLLSFTPDPEKTIAAAAKLCYSAASVGDLMDELSEEKARGFVEMLSGLGHESPLEHVSFTFGIEDVSRALLAQITRHRIASYSVQSQRYVRKGRFTYIVPPAIAADGQALAEYEKTMQTLQQSYDRITQILMDNHAKRLMQQGVQEKSAHSQAEKMAIEDARFVLPNACDTKMIVTMNTRSLLNFFEHRCCNRAQWEIRQLADQMLGLVYAVAPALFAKAGPACVGPGCREGKMSCARAQEMRGHIGRIKREARECGGN